MHRYELMECVAAIRRTPWEVDSATVTLDGRLHVRISDGQVERELDISSVEEVAELCAD